MFVAPSVVQGLSERLPLNVPFRNVHSVHCLIIRKSLSTVKFGVFVNSEVALIILK